MKYFLLGLIFWSFNSYSNFSDLYKEFENILDKDMEKEDEIISFGKKINSYIKKTPFKYSWKGSRFKGYSIEGRVNRLKKVLKKEKSQKRDMEILSLFRSFRSKELFCFKSVVDKELDLYNILYSGIYNSFVRKLLLFHFQYQHKFGVSSDGYQYSFYTPLLSDKQLDLKSSAVKVMVDTIKQLGRPKNCIASEPVVLTNRDLHLNKMKVLSKAPLALDKENPHLKARKALLLRYSRIYPEKLFIYLGKNTKEDIQNAFEYRDTVGKKKLLFSYHLDNKSKAIDIPKNNFSKELAHPGQMIFDLKNLGLLKGLKTMKRNLKKALAKVSDPQKVILSYCKNLKGPDQALCFGLF